MLFLCISIGEPYQCKTWLNFENQYNKFAPAGSISKRRQHRYPSLRKRDYILINPTLTHPGWKLGKIMGTDRVCGSGNLGQVYVRYKYDKQYWYYWTHLDDETEVKINDSVDINKITSQDVSESV